MTSWNTARQRDVLRTARRSWCALIAMLLAAISNWVPYRAIDGFAQVAEVAFVVALVNILYCAVRLVVAGDRIVTTVALVVCVLATAIAFFLIPLVGH